MHVWINDFAVVLVAAADLPIVVAPVAIVFAVRADVNRPTSR